MSRHNVIDLSADLSAARRGDTDTSVLYLIDLHERDLIGALPHLAALLYEEDCSVGPTSLLDEIQVLRHRNRTAVALRSR
jgi:hypothetical protein